MGPIDYVSITGQMALPRTTGGLAYEGESLIHTKTVYEADGTTVDYVDQFSDAGVTLYLRTVYADNGTTAQHTTEYRPDGVTALKRTNFQSDGTTIDHVVYYQADGTTADYKVDYG